MTTITYGRSDSAAIEPPETIVLCEVCGAEASEILPIPGGRGALAGYCEACLPCRRAQAANGRLWRRLMGRVRG